MTTRPYPVPPSSPTVVPLDAADRCDRCRAQAYVRATMPSKSEVTLCAHHGRKHEVALRAQGGTIVWFPVPA